MTGAADRRSLHLDPPSVLSDESLGERLAALARSSTPTASPRARRHWGLPVAGAVVALATAGATFGADQVRHHGDGPQPVVPATRLERSTSHQPLVPTAADEHDDEVQPVEPPTTFHPTGGDDGGLSDSHRRGGTSGAASHPGDSTGDDPSDDSGDDQGDDAGHDGGHSDGSERSEPSDGDSATGEASDDAPDGSDGGRDSGDGAAHDGGSDTAGTGGTGEHDG
ncbi:hypothetical protein GCM10009798_18900 [Nocardioides panacihumi]|uniref:Uncharacterized protein n=1 Tax=Nocardioides panacihumi TaxID=400774 RepID=A0ABN2QWW7_9ACTN